LSIPPLTSSPSLAALRCTAMELLALAMVKLFPNILLASGAIDDIGFHYDFVTNQPIDDQAIPLIESEMWALIKSEGHFKSLHMMRENAVTLFAHHGQTVKAGILKEHPDNILDIIQMGDFHDLCPHHPPIDSSAIGALKIEGISPMTIDGQRAIRITGTAFSDKQQLKQFLKRAENARKQDHKLLMPALKMASCDTEAGPHCWFWHPKGVTLRGLLRQLWDDAHREQQFKEIVTPPLFNFDEAIPHTAASVKARHARFIQRLGPIPEKELPLRYAEWTTKCKDVTLDDLKGLLRTWTYTTDRAHIFCTAGQVCQELISSLQFIDRLAKVFDFETQWLLCLRREKFSSTLGQWKRSVDWLTEALNLSHIAYEVDEENSVREGPRAQLMLIDALGRRWRGPYVGIDCYHPETSELRYAVGQQQHPLVMISRSSFGSLERFIAVLIEKVNGNLPLWLAPEQVRLLPIAPRHGVYASEIGAQLKANGYRVTIDSGDTALGNRVHQAEVEKVPYLIIIGDQEEKKKTLTVRGGARQQRMEMTMRIDEFIAHLASNHNEGL
jgi:threonyl-tRNA synthetase